MDKLRKDIEATMELSENSARLFYQQKPEEGFRVLESVINSIMTTVTNILHYQSEHNVAIFEDQIFNVVLNEAMKAIEQKDMILFADLLVFEVNDILRGCLNRL